MGALGRPQLVEPFPSSTAEGELLREERGFKVATLIETGRD